jgi:hypothetical protein
MRLKTVCVLLVGALCAGCKDDPPPAPARTVDAVITRPGESPPPADAPVQTMPAATSDADDPFRDLNWTAVSQDSTAVLMQTHVGDGRCKRVCNDSPNGKELWSADGCIGKKIDLRFVANDCGKSVVLHQLPEVKNGARWQEVEVAHVYKEGAQAYAVNAAGAVRDFKKIRSAGNTFYWLSGALNIPGAPPRYSADGDAVEFTTVDGKKQSIPLTGK